MKALRRTRDLSLQEVADAAEISKAHVWDLERGKAINPTIETLCKLGVALKTDAALLCSAAIVDQGSQ